MRRVYTPWLQLGQLDERGGDDSGSAQPFRGIGPDAIDTPAHRQLALEAAQQSMVLLQNKGGLLPLDSEQKVVMLGPHLNSTQALISIYHMDMDGVYSKVVEEQSPLMALQRRGAAVAGHAPGCADGVACLDSGGFDEAVELAKQADVVPLLFVGLIPGHAEMPTPRNDSCDAREDEGKDRPFTYLPGQQHELVRRVAAANPKTILVLIHGGSLALDAEKASVPVILDAHYPGQQGGDAIAGALYGDYSPAGRLTTTYYPASLNDARNISDMGLREKGGITYQHYESTPLWGYGHGLSYSGFRFSLPQPTLAADTGALAAYYPRYFTERGAQGSPLQLKVTVENAGDVASDVVVLGFALLDHTDAPRGGRLFGFERVRRVPPHGTASVTLGVPPQSLSVVDTAGVERILPGQVQLRVGVQGAAEGAPVTAQLSLTGDPVTLFSLPAARARASAA
jgi:hypothetical protein